MPVMKSTRTLRDGPNGVSLSIEAKAGTRVTVAQTVSGWTQITLIDVTNTPSGWVATLAIDLTSDVLGPLDKTVFAIECHTQAAIFDTSGHYLAAIATLRTDVTDGAHAKGTGPFALSPREWQMNATQPQFSLAAAAGDIASWRLQVAVFAIMARLTQRKLAAAGNPPNVLTLYLAQLLGTNAAAAALLGAGNVADLIGAIDAAAAAADGIDVANLAQRHGEVLGNGTVAAGVATLAARLDEALDASRSFVQTAGDQLMADSQATVAAMGTVSGKINFDSPEINQARRPMAELIAQRFGERGYGVIQQIAAIANAIGESNLNPEAAGDHGNSIGLFQLNMAGGVGSGFTASVLKNPERNIAIMLDYIATLGVADARFKAASSTHDAVAVFVTDFERPADTAGAIARRSQIAATLIV
jgi:hypothetical protein